ncbi:titin-like isoform X2 [Diabrotica virgifera virgifera]|uniref:Uncharacterized protein n=1 Tax=Diabrotica virgifera virgifera TaxID=50390 RepID=A0ABM5JKK1_DIAVI|nr:titin-like isoform X2 [Diabrotica virgifera virgifera]
MASKDLPIDLLKADINNIKKYIQKALQEETINESLLSEGIDTLGNISPTIKPKAFIKYVLKYIELVIIFGNGRDYYTQATVTRKYFNHITDMIPAEVQEEFLRQGTRLVFDYVLEENTENWCIKKELLRFFNDTSLDCKRKVKHDIVDKLPQIYLLKLVDSVTSCADYDLQAVILELIFRMYSQRIIHSKLYELIPESEELTSLFSQIKAVTFDEDLKKFLNTLNAKYDKVFTLLCTDIILDNTCSIPVEEGFDVHFNVWHKALSWYQLQQDEDGHETWELITVFVSNVDIAYTRNKKEEPEKLFLEIKLNGPCLTSLTSYQESRDVIRDITVVTKKSEITDEHLYRSLLQKFFDGKFRILPNENLNILRTDVIPAPENESIEQLPTSNQSDESSLNVLDPATTTLHDSRISSKNISTDESKRLLTSSGSVAEIISIVTTTEHDVTTDLSEHRTSPIKNLTPLKILGGRCTGRAVIYKNLIRSQGSSVEQNFTESIQKTNQNFNISVEESKDETEYSTAIEDPDTSTSELTEQFESMKVVIDHRRSSKEKALSKPKSIKGLKSKNNNQRTKTKKKQNESTTGKHKPGSGNYVIEEDNYVSPPALTVLPKVKPSPTVDETERDQKKMSFKVSTCIKTTKTAKENGLKTKPLKGIKIKNSKKPVLDILGQKFDHDNENQSSAAVSASTQQNTSEKSVKISASDGTDEYNSQKSPIESQETFSESSKGKTNNSISEEKFIEGIDVNEKSLEHEKTFPAQDETERDPKKMLSSKVSTCIKTKNDAKENELKTKVSSNLKGTKINKSKKTVNQKKTEFDHGNESQHLAAVSALTQQNAKDLLQSVKASAFDRTREYGSQKSLVEPEESVLGTKETISEEFDSNYLLPPTRIVLPKASTSKITVSESKGKADDSISEEECIELIDVKEKSLEQQQTFPAVDETGRDQKKMLSSKVSTCTKTTKSAKDHQIKPSVPSVLEEKEVIKKSKKPMRSKHRRRSDVLDQEVDHDNESQPSTVVSAFSQQDARDLLQSLKISAFDRTHEYGSQKSLIESEENVLGTEENVLGTKEIISEEFDSNYLLPPTRMILPKASTCKITISETKGNVGNAISEEESIEVIDVKEKSLEQQLTFPTIDETGRDRKKMLSSKVSTCTKTTKNAKDHQIKPSVPSVLEGVEVIKKSKKPMRSKHLRRSDVLDQEVENDNESQPLTVVSALTQQNSRDIFQSVKASAFDRTREYGSQKSLVESEESVLGTKETMSEEFDSNYLLPPTRTILPKASTCKITVSESKSKADDSISEEECIELIDVKEKSLEQQQTFPTVDETGRDQKTMLSSKVSTCTRTTKSTKDHQIKPSVPSVLEGIEVIKKSKKPMRSKHLRHSDVLDQEVDHGNESQPSTVVSALTQQNAKDLLQSVKASAFDRTREYGSQKSMVESEESVLGTKEIISEEFDSNYLLPPTRTVLPKASTCKITVSETKGNVDNAISEEESIEVIDVKEKSLEQQQTFPTVDETARDQKKMLSSKVSTSTKTTKNAKDHQIKPSVPSVLEVTEVIKKSKKPMRSKHLRRSDVLDQEVDHDNESQPLTVVSALTQQNAKDLLQSVKASEFDRTREYGSQKSMVESEESVLGTKEIISEEFDSNYLLPPTRTVLPEASTSKITVSESKGKADDSISEEECIELIDVKEKSLEQQQTFPTVDETGRDQKTMLASKVSTHTKSTKNVKKHQIESPVPSVLEGTEVIKKSKKPMDTKLDEVGHDNESQPLAVVSTLTQQNARDILQSVKASAFDRTREYGSQKSLVEAQENVLGTKEIISEEFDSNYLLPPTRIVSSKASTCKITVSESKGKADDSISEEECIELIDVKEKSLEQQQTFPTVDETARDQKKMLSSKVSTSTKTTKSAKDHQIKPSVPSVLEGKEVIKKSKKPMRSKHLRRSDVLDQEVDHDNESQPSTVVSALTQQDARDLLQSVKISAFDRTHEYDSQKSLIESEESVLSTKEIISEKFDSNYLLPPTRTVLPKASTCKINVSGSKDKMHISISDEECIEVIDVKEETLEQQETFPSVVETERDRTKKSSSKVSSAVKGTKIKKSKKPVRGKNLRRSDILGEEFDHDNESQPSAALSALTQQNASEISVKISAFDEADEYEPQKSPIETEETVSKSSKSKANNLISEDKSIEVIDVKEKTLAQQKTFSAIDETESDQKKMLSSKVSTKSTKNAKEPQLKLQVSSVLKGMEVIKKSKTPVQTKPLLCADILDREKKFENQKEIQSVSGLKEQNIKEKPVKISSCDRKNSIEILVNQEIISENVTEEVNSKYFLPPRLNASPNSTCVEKSFTVTDAEEMLEQQKILPTIEEDERNRKEILSPKVSACIKTTRKAKGKKLKPQQRKKLTTLKEQNTRETPVKISIFDEIEENVTGSNKENEQPALETFADSPIKMKSKRFENEQQTEEEEKIFKPPDAVSPEVSITKYASHESSIHNDLEHGKELGNQKEKPKLSDTTSNLNANLNSKDTEQVLTFPKLIVLLDRFDSNLQKKRTISKPIEDVSENRKSEQIQSMSNDLILKNIEDKSMKSPDARAITLDDKLNQKGSTSKVEKENVTNYTTVEAVVTLKDNLEHQNEKETLKSIKSTTQSLRKRQKKSKRTQIMVPHDEEVIQDFTESTNSKQSSFSDPKVKEKVGDKEKSTSKLQISGEKMYDNKIIQESAVPTSKSSDIDLNLKNIEQVPSFNQLVELLDRQSSFSDPKVKEKIYDKEKSTAKLQISGEKMYDDKMAHDNKIMQEAAVPTSISTDIGVGLQNIEQSPSFDQLVELLDRYGYGVQKKTTVSKPIEDVSEKSKEPVLSTVVAVKECGLADDEKDTQASTLDIDVSSQVIQAKTNVQEEIIDDDLKQGEKSEGPRSKKIHISESSSDETECEGNSVLDEELNESIIIMKIDKTIGNNKIDLVQPILQNEKDDTCIRNTSVKDIEVTTMLDHSEKNLSEKGQEDIIRRPRALNAVLTDSDMSIEDFSSEVQKLPPADKKDGGEENSVKTLSNEKPLEFDRLAADNKKVISGEKKTKEVNEKNKENNLPPTEPKVIPIERSCMADKTNNSSIRRKRKLYDPNDLSVFSHLEDEVERYEKMTKEQQIEMEEGIDKSNTIDKSRLLLLSSAKEGHSSTTYKKKSASLNFVKKYQDPSINGRINLTTSYVRSKKPKKGTNSRNRSYLSGMITLHKRNKHESSVNISKADRTMLNRTLHKIFGWPDEGDSFLKKVLKKSHANASELKTQEYVESQDENTGSPVIVKAKGPTKKKRLPNDQIRYADLIRARDARSHKAKETFMKILQDIQDDLNDGESLMDMLRKSKEKPTAKEKRSSKNRSRRSKTKANNSSKVKRSNVPQKRRSSTPHRSDQCSSNKKRKIKGTKIARKNSGTSKKGILGETSNNL